MSQTQPSILNPAAPANRNPGAILKARARALARPAERQSEGRFLRVVEFRLAQERYAVEQTSVREIQPLTQLTPMPGTPPFIRGIVNVRGQILCVIDIKKFFALSESGITDLHNIIIIEGDGVAAGILADAVTGVSAIALDGIAPTLPTLAGIRAQYLRGVTDQRVVILDAAKILADPNIVVNDET